MRLLRSPGPGAGIERRCATPQPAREPVQLPGIWLERYDPVADRRKNQQRFITLALDRDKLSLFMASLLATVVMALSFFYGKVDFVTVAERVAMTVFIVYPVTFFVVWRVIHVVVAELAAEPPEAKGAPEASDETETNAGEGA